jgi:YD repeat-containing protein
LLNFLSRTAAQSERGFLKPTPVPEFARIKSLSGGCGDEDLDQLLLRQRRRIAKRAVRSDVGVETPVESRLGCNSLLGKLADTLARCCEASDMTAPGTDFCDHHGANDDRPWQIADVTTVSILEEALPAATGVGAEWHWKAKTSECLIDLDQWLNGCGDPSEADERLESTKLFGLSQSDLHRSRSGSLPAALPPVLPSPFELSSLEEPLTVGVNVDMYEPIIPAKAEKHANKFSSRHKRALFNRRVVYRPRTITLPDGARKERFDNGAELSKDALGRVVEIRAAHGATVSVQYDQEGKPRSFMRTLRNGGNHSLGELDRHGVVVRDPEGRVRAAGESMAVDPAGCLSVRRFDGQFWSLDLVRGVHIERRRVNDREGNTHVLTALFAFDGFRMVTRFQPVTEGKSESEHGKKWLAEEPTGAFRFYGRDGSMIQFDSEDDLVELKPSRVWQPGSRAVNPNWRGHHQAGTAWESVQEYVTNYLLA